MNKVLSEILASGRVVTADGEAVELHSHIPLPECQVIETWIQERLPKKILEIGLGFGISALCISEAIRELAAKYDIIDPFQHSDFGGLGLENLERAGCGDLFTFHEKPSELCLPDMLSAGRSFDFALIDGNHRVDHVLLDFFFVNRMLAVGGLIVFDDTHLPSVSKALAHIASYDCYRPVETPGGMARDVRSRARRLMGLPELRIAAVEKTGPDERDWDWFRDF